MLVSLALRLRFACKGLLVLRSSSLEPCGALLGDSCCWDKHSTRNREHHKLNYALKGLSVPSLPWVGSFVVVLVRTERRSCESGCASCERAGRCFGKVKDAMAAVGFSDRCQDLPLFCSVAVACRKL